MSKKLICLVSFVLVLGLASSVSAELIGHWKFDEGSSDVAHDVSGNGYDGTINGSPNWVPGVGGSALEFDGTDDYVGTGKSLLDNMPEFTLAFWVSAGNPGSGRIGLVGQNDLVEMGFNGGNVEIWTSATGTTNTPWTFDNYTWHHITVVGDATSMNIYLDGELAVTGGGTANYGTSTFPVNIGGGGIWDASGNWFLGQIDDVRIYNQALTETEIERLAVRPKAHSPSPTDKEENVHSTVVLSWSAGYEAVSHDVYLGTDETAVTNADTSSPEYKGNQTGTTYSPAGLLGETTYYWRIDELNSDGTVTKGDVWSFTGIKALRIVSWNIQFLGARNPPRTQEQINAIAQRILTFDAAVLALQEITVVPVLEDIRSQLGASWRIYHSGMENVLLYDESKVEMLSVEILNNLENLPYTRYPGANHRRPVSGVFRPVRTYADPFRVIGVHCHWADANIRTSEAIWLRTKTIELLGNPDELNDIVLLGDFNSQPWSTPHRSLQEGNILDLLPKENGDSTHVFGSAIDHCYVTQGAKHRLTKKSIFVIRPEHYGETSAQFNETYSDHLPIFIDLEPEACTGLDAHWKLDETEGIVAADSVGNNDGSVVGGPVWQPSGGMVDGALQFDGIDDCITTPSVLDPAVGKFSVFAWIKGGAPGQVIMSQADRIDRTVPRTYPGSTWLCTDPSDGKLMTELRSPSRGGGHLLSQTIITDGNWHRVGFVWDGSYRSLYVDGAEVAKDSKPLSGLESADGGLYIGAGKTLDAGCFFSGLIDDVRIYHRTLSAGEIKAIMVGWAVEDFETGDFVTFPWEHYGETSWTIASGERHSGTYSAKAGAIDHDESTTLRVTLNCVSGDITFSRKVSSEEDFDYLRFYIDGEEKDKWSGTEDWAEISLPVTEGTRTFEWTYSKDGSVSRGSDTAWIDDIVFPIN